MASHGAAENAQEYPRNGLQLTNQRNYRESDNISSQKPNNSSYVVYIYRHIPSLSSSKQADYPFVTCTMVSGSDSPKTRVKDAHLGSWAINELFAAESVSHADADSAQRKNNNFGHLPRKTAHNKAAV